MRSAAGAILLVVGCVTATNADRPVAVSGHGGLTVGIDSRGVVSVCRWPGPGDADQLAYRDSAELGRAASRHLNGAQWGIAVGDSWRWVGDPEFTIVQKEDDTGILKTMVSDVSAGLRAEVSTFVVPGRDVMVSAIEVFGPDGTIPRVVWAGDFDPTTRQIPELPIGDRAFDGQNDFAAFADADRSRVWQFRPDAPGMDTWRKADTLASAGAAPEKWKAFGEGVWIGISAGSGSVHAGCGLVSDFRARNPTGTDASAAVVGDAYNIIEPTVEETQDGYRAWIAVAFGKDYDSASALLDGVTADSFEALLRGSKDGSSGMSSQQLTGIPESSVPYLQRCWSMLRTCRDSVTGRVVRSPAVVPPEARDWPRYGAWIALALEAYGDAASARKILVNYLEAIRMEDRPGEPYGSMPESFYTDGTLASPHFFVDDRAVARVLWAVEAYTTTLSPEAREAFVRAHWSAVSAAGDFLAGWVDRRRGAPLWSADPIRLRDSNTQERTIDALAGMNAAIGLSKLAGEPAPEAWQIRQAALVGLVTQVLTAPSTDWQPGEPLLYDLRGLPEDVLDAVAERTRKKANMVTNLSGARAGALLVQRAIVARDIPGQERVPASALAEGLAGIVLDRENGGKGGRATPDAVAASYGLIAAQIWREGAVP